ncbi:MAG: hypothetical protein K8R36_21305 [Planctomycetales bacterium]|nr:hypothetical protein [Planctomycetales bacterium]
MWHWIRYSLLAIFILLVFLFGLGGKTEFSPDTVQIRTSVFWGSPQFSIPTSTYSTPGLDYARERLRDAQPIHVNPRWWLIHESGAGIACGIGPGQMGSRIGTDDFVEWSREHPDLADQFWPRWGKMMREENWIEADYIVRHVTYSTDRRSFDQVFATAHE